MISLPHCKSEQILKRIVKPEVRRQKKLRLVIFEHKLTQLKRDWNIDIVRYCFDSKKLPRAQLHLEQHGYDTHEEWRSERRTAHSSSLFVLGSIDENCGCQGCVVTVGEGSNISVGLRSPNSASGKHAVINGLTSTV